MFFTPFTGCIDLSTPKPVEKKRTFNEETIYRSGEQAIDCGTSYYNDDKAINECMVESFYSYQPFYANILTGLFQPLGISHTSFSFNGISLLTLSNASCTNNNDQECSRFYTINECINPTPITTTELNDYIFMGPFKCDELIEIKGN
jgi:hypothetical protein